MSDESKQIIRIKLSEKQREWGASFKEWVGTHLHGEITLSDVEVNVKQISDSVQWTIERHIREIIETEVLSLIKRQIESEVASEIVQNLMKEFNIADEVKKHMSSVIYGVATEKVKVLMSQGEAVGLSRIHTSNDRNY